MLKKRITNPHFAVWDVYGLNGNNEYVKNNEMIRMSNELFSLMSSHQMRLCLQDKQNPPTNQTKMTIQNLGLE